MIVKISEYYSESLEEKTKTTTYLDLKSVILMRPSKYKGVDRLYIEFSDRSIDFFLKEGDLDKIIKFYTLSNFIDIDKI